MNMLCHSFPLNGQFDTKSDASTEGEESHEYLNIYNTVNFQAHEQDRDYSSKSKLKSSLCRNFTEKGFCPYGNKCQFAHGPEELKINNQANTSYKTKRCHAFLKKGYCQFGYRCNFVHEEIHDSSQDFSGQKMKNFR